MRRKCEVGTAPADSAKLITSLGFLRCICLVAVDGGSAAAEGARGRILAAQRGFPVPPSPAATTRRRATPLGSAARTRKPVPMFALHPRGGRPTRAAPPKLRAPILTI